MAPSMDHACACGGVLQGLPVMLPLSSEENTRYPFPVLAYVIARLELLAGLEKVPFCKHN